MDQENRPREYNEEQFENFYESEMNQGSSNNINPPSNINVNDMLATINALVQQNSTMLNLLQNNTVNSNNHAVVGNPINSYHIMPDLSKSIQNFDGVQDPEFAEKWLKKLETTANLHAWPDAFTYQTATIHLVGPARYWLTSKPEIIDWFSFRHAFSKTFLFRSSKTQQWKAMQACIQKPRDNVSAYFMEKVALCKSLCLDFEEVKEQIAIGLLSRELSSYIMTRNHRDEDDLYQDIISFERIDTARKTRIKEEKGNISLYQRENVNTIAKHELKIEKNTIGNQNKHFRPPIKNEKGEFKCYNCQDYGHKAIECNKEKKPIKCYKCGTDGHTSRNCIKPKPISNSNAEINMIEEENNANKGAKYIKCIKLDNKDFIALIDTGSSDSTIKASKAILGEFKIERDSTTLRGFGENNVVESCGNIYGNLEVDEVIINDIKFRIVPDNVQPVDVIIGRNFTEIDTVAYYKVDNQFVFKNRNNLELCVPDMQSSSSKIKIMENQKIMSNSINFLEAEISDKQVCIPVINSNNHICELNKNQYLSERILNIEEIQHEIEKNQEPIHLEDLKLEKGLDVKQKREILCLINEFRDCVAKNIFEIGKSDIMEMKIEEKPNSLPVNQKPYKTNLNDRQKIKEIVSEWKRAGIVEETSSSYASPVLLVTKKNGESRLVVDYRRLNKQTERMAFPVPNLDEQLEILQGNSIFATLDLAHGYLQMPLAKESRNKTAFITPDETGEFTRAIFGLMNAPFYFSKLMQTVLEPLMNKTVVFYLDDMLIPAKDWEELMLRLRQVLELLRKANLTIKLPKCEFGKQQVEYLGYRISNIGIEPGLKKLEAIKLFPAPKDIHGVRRFIGLASFFRRFVPQFAQIAEPLTKLTRKEKPFEWNVEQQTSFDKLKQILTNQPVLKLFNPNAEKSELHTDASSKGLGAILLQTDQNGIFHPIYAVSRRTSDTEKSYHSSKLELLAIVWAIERLKVFLMGIKFTILTDCQALIYLHKFKTQNAQIVRWYNILSEYDFDIKYRSGQQMKHVDAISRDPVEESEEIEDIIIDKLSVFSIISGEEEIALYQYSDEDFKSKIDILKRDRSEWTQSEKSLVQDYKMKNGLLYKSLESDGDTKDLYAVPKTMRKALTIKFHDLMSHQGSEKTYRKMKNYYYFPGMKQYINRHIKMCVECILVKNQVGKQAGYLHPIPPGKRPFDIIHIDHLGPFVVSRNGFKYVLLVIDNLTKFVQLLLVRNTKTEAVLRKLQTFIGQFGAPGRIISDRGTCFTSIQFKNFCQRHGIQHILNSSRHPQANGLVERLNSTLLAKMQSTLEDEEGRDWDKHIPAIERHINTSENKTTGKTPFELLYGYLPRYEDGLTRTLTKDNETYQIPEKLREEVRNKIEVEQQKYKTRYDKHRYQGLKYNVGDIVYVKAAITNTGESTKLQYRYKGPLVVIEVLPSDTYRITNLLEKNKFQTTAHVSQLKLWKNYNEDNDDVEENGTEQMELKQTKIRPMEEKESDVHEEKHGDDENEKKSRRRKKKPKHLEDYEL